MPYKFWYRKSHLRYLLGVLKRPGAPDQARPYRTLVQSTPTCQTLTHPLGKDAPTPCFGLDIQKFHYNSRITLKLKIINNDEKQSQLMIKTITFLSISKRGALSYNPPSLPTQPPLLPHVHAHSHPDPHPLTQPPSPCLNTHPTRTMSRAACP